jgi:hypothetical protein
MSNVLVFPSDRAQAVIGRAPHLGPAVVSRVLASGEVEVRLSTGKVATALSAVAFSYEPVADDVVLVIGDESAFYVIGVLAGRGKATIEAHGDLEIRAAGKVHIAAGEGVVLQGPEVAVQADKLRMVAGAVTQTFGSLYRRVTELLATHAGQRHTVVEGTSHEQAKSATILTEEKMTINGKAIYLG